MLRQSLPSRQSNRRSQTRTALSQTRQTFPGLDPDREVKLKLFLFQPIDSRLPFDDVPETKNVMKIPRRLNEPTPEIKSEWSERMERIRRRKDINDRPFAVYPSLPEREQLMELSEQNPLNLLPIEEVVEARDLKIHGPMNQRTPNMPKFRYLPHEFLNTSYGTRKRQKS